MCLKAKPATITVIPTAYSMRRVTVTSVKEMILTILHIYTKCTNMRIHLYIVHAQNIYNKKGLPHSFRQMYTPHPPAENCQLRSLKYTRAAKTARQRVLFMVAAPYSWIYKDMHIHMYEWWLSMQIFSSAEMTTLNVYL